MVVGNLLFVLFVLGAAAEPTAVILDVELVRVAPFRPGTQTPWDPPTEKAQKDNCEALGWLGAAVGFVGGVGLGAAPAGATAANICRAVVGVRQATKTPAPTDPDLFVRLVASRELAYRSYTAHNTTSHVFHFRVAVPLDAIPTPGLQLYVENDRGVGSDASHEVIGSVRLHRKDVLAALGGDGVLRLDDKSGGLDRIEIEVTEAEMPKNFEGRGDLSKFALFRLEGEDFPAGIVAEVGETGTYELDVPGTFTPVGHGTSSFSFQDPTFRSAPYGAGIAVVGEGGHLAEHVVGPCGRFLVTAPGAVLVGVNARGRRSGTIGIEVRSRPATIEEWRTGKATGKCKPPAEPTLAAADSRPPTAPETAPVPPAPPSGAWPASAVAATQQLVQANGASIAVAIQRILHPSGSGATLRDFGYVPGPGRVRFRFATSWRGALGAHHLTTVVWELGPEGHRRATVLSDTAEIKAGRRNLDELNRYFATKLYPQVAPSVGPAN